nr:geraniol 8-hydroxylase-like [Coffea arabica]
MELHILLFCISLFLFIMKPFFHGSSSRKTPPGPKGLPIIGSLLELGPRPNQSLAALAKIHGPIMTLKLGSITTIVASSPEAAKEILQKQEQVFSDRTVPCVVTAQPYHKTSLAWAPGDQRWRSYRRICATQMFTNQRLDLLQPLRHKKVEDLMLYFKKHSDSTAPVDIGRASFATALNVISSTMFSIDIVDLDSENAQEFKDLILGITHNAGKPNLSDYFPLIKPLDLQGVKQNIRPFYQRLNEIFDDLIFKRLEARKSGESRKDDFLDVLLDQCEEEGSGFNHETIKSLSTDFFIAGSDTNAISVEWAMAELLRKPEAMQKARDEIIQNIGFKRLVKDSDIDQLPYLQAVVKETMRLHPPTPLLIPYKANKDTQVFGFNVPKDSQVLVNAWAIGRDPSYWENPASFSPERFLGSCLDFKGRDFEYIPFGAGRRICPGIPLAIRMVSLMLASCIQAFRWRLPEGIAPEKLDMEEQFGLTLRKAVPLCVIPILEEKQKF